ncbi:MAG: hypothetical protein O7B99_08295 [Planctomycetota bacterium]|nr:hypothetical protein [Planctomycetota bacterium]
MTEQAPPEKELPPYRIEAARSSRSRCRTCRRKIDKGNLRLGVLLEGPYGTGYLWHHLTCAARRRSDDVEAAYEQPAWEPDLEDEIPPLAQLRKLKEEADQRKSARRDPPYVERAPTGRAKCKHCGETIEQGAFRVVLLREVRFGSQVRGMPINVHPRCVGAELRGEDCLTEIEAFEDALRTNTPELSEEEAVEVLGLVGELE